MAYKSNLRQQKLLVEAIQKEPRVVMSVKLLRDFLIDCGYENPYMCRHFLIERISGRCSSCGIIA